MQNTLRQCNITALTEGRKITRRNLNDVLENVNCIRNGTLVFIGIEYTFQSLK